MRSAKFLESDAVQQHIDRDAVTAFAVKWHTSPWRGDLSPMVLPAIVAARAEELARLTVADSPGLLLPGEHEQVDICWAAGLLSAVFETTPVTFDELVLATNFDVAATVAATSQDHRLPRGRRVAEQCGRMHGASVLAHTVLLGRLLAELELAAKLLRTAPSAALSIYRDWALREVDAVLCCVVVPSTAGAALRQARTQAATLVAGIKEQETVERLRGAIKKNVRRTKRTDDGIAD